MKTKLEVVFSVAVGLLMATSSLWAHHSDALYDMTRLKVLKGTITKHQLTNPHQIIRMKVKDANGKVTPWVLVGHSVPVNRKAGWTKDSLKAGDVVEVWGFPYKDGTPNMQWERMEKADGTVLPIRGAMFDKLDRYLRVYGKDQLSREDYELLKKSLGTEPTRFR